MPRRRTVRDPMTGRRINVHPTREELQAELATEIERCIANFAKSREVGWSKRYRHLAYRMREEFGTDPPPLY